MKVYYPGPGAKTYHPKLGKLTQGLYFELDDNTAKPYIRGGLLQEPKDDKTLEAESDEPEE